MAVDASARFPSEPRASRLRLPPGYAGAATQEAILPWQHAEERLERARNYWLATTHP